MSKFELQAVPVEGITDYKGAEHYYEVTPKAFDESFDLGVELADLIGGPIGDALKALMMGGDVDLDDIGDQEIGTVLQVFASLPRRILDAKGSRLLARVLAGTMRSSDPEGEDEKRTKLHLENADARTQAFGGGNQAEVVEAVKAVLEVNYGPFLVELYGLVSPYLSGFGEGLKNLGQKKPKTPKSGSEGASGSNTSEPSKPTEPE